MNKLTLALTLFFTISHASANQSYDLMKHFPAAFERAKQFVPKAQFHKAQSRVISGFNGFCEEEITLFTFIDAEQYEMVYVEARYADITQVGEEIKCTLAYDVKIQHDYFSMAPSMQTLENPFSRINLSFTDALKLVEAKFPQKSLHYATVQIEGNESGIVAANFVMTDRNNTSVCNADLSAAKLTCSDI